MSKENDIFIVTGRLKRMPVSNIYCNARRPVVEFFARDSLGFRDMVMRQKKQFNRVCIVGLRGIPDVMGGVETHCEELYPRIASLAAGKYSIVLFARRSYVPKEIKYRGILVVPVFSPKNRYLEAIVHTTISIFMSKFRFKADIIHIHAIGPSLMVPIAKLLGMHVVVTHHGEDYLRKKWNFIAKLALRLGEYIACKLSDRVIVISESIETRLKAMPGAASKRLRKIPNGITSFATPSGEDRNLAQFGVESNRYIIAVGRLVPEKGFRDLVTAFNAIRHLRPEYKLLIVGDTDHKDSYCASLLAQADSSVIFAGRQSRPDIFNLLQNASLFVLPSYHEGLPIAALEALGCDIPILLSDINGNREIGLAKHHYFSVGNIDELSACLSRDYAVYQPDRNAAERFDWNKIARSTLAVYDELLVREDASNLKIENATT